MKTLNCQFLDWPVWIAWKGSWKAKYEEVDQKYNFHSCDTSCFSATKTCSLHIAASGEVVAVSLGMWHWWAMLQLSGVGNTQSLPDGLIGMQESLRLEVSTQSGPQHPAPWTSSASAARGHRSRAGSLCGENAPAASRRRWESSFRIGDRLELSSSSGHSLIAFLLQPKNIYRGRCFDPGSQTFW